MASADSIIKRKLGVLEPARRRGDVPDACRAMGCSRDSYYRLK